MDALLTTFTQPRLDLQAIDRERHERRRRLYQSCDHCRMYRRPCDAVNLGINPFRGSEPSIDGHQVQCTTCRKAGRNCTFERLHALTQRNFQQQRAKPRVDAARHRSTNLGATAGTKPWTTANDHTEAGATNNNSFHSQPLVSKNNVSDSNSTYWPPVVADSNLESTSNHKPPNQFDFLLDIPYPHFLGAPSEGDDETRTTNSSSFASTNPSSSSPTGESELILTAGSGWSPRRPLTWSTAPTSQADDDLEFSNWPEVTALSSSTKPSFATYAMLRFQEPDATPAKRKTTNVNSLVAPRFLQEVNKQEGRLYEVTNKSFIISGLKQIYDNSLENGMSLWGTEENCPYEEPTLRLRKTLSREDSSALLPTSLYQRVYQLDQSLASIRARPLTAAEEAGSSRALKLAIMAFASRWSHSPIDVFSQSEGFEDIISQDDMSEFSEFEHLLQQSLYTGAIMCIERWSECDSFRVILAQLLVFFIQKPPERRDVMEVQDHWTAAQPQREFGKQHREPSIEKSDEANKIPKSADEPSDESSSTNHFTTSQSFRNLMRADSRKSCLRMALRHLLSWSPKIRTFTKRALLQCKSSSAPVSIKQVAMRTSSNFNILFWLGVMCDTASSALDRRALTISDSEAELHLSEPLYSGSSPSPDLPDSDVGPTSPPKDNLWESSAVPKLWGKFLLHSETACENPYLFQGPAFMERAEKVLREASPIKILLLRRVCQLQTLMRDEAPTEAIEHCINDTLQVCTYWNTRFSAFFSNCIAQHHNIPFKIRSWYVMLLGHFNLGYLSVANIIEQFDKKLDTETMQSSLRRSKFLVLQLQKEGIYSIANLARVSYTDVLTNGYDKSNTEYHSSCRGSSLLTDPCGDLMFLALSTSCDTFLSWSRIIQEPLDPENPESAWLHRNVDLDVLLHHCSVCIKALKIFGKQYDVASVIAKVFEERVKSGMDKKCDE